MATNTFNIFIMKSFSAIINAWPPRRCTASRTNGQKRTKVQVHPNGQQQPSLGAVFSARKENVSIDV